jgi:two-component system nitrate/nitrite sensor histidine kinase NarX
VFDDLFAALTRVARASADDDAGASLRAALLDASRIAGADLIVLRLPDGPSDHLEIRLPDGASWPSARLLDRWHADVAQRRRPVGLASRDRPRRPAVRAGLVFPIFTGTGALGALGLFSTKRSRFSAEQCAGPMLLVQAATARIEAERLRRRTEAVTTTDVHDRVARELHDGPLQLLSGIMLHLRLVRTTADEKSSAAMEGLEIELEQSIKQTRALIRNLRVAHPQATLEDRVREALARLERTRGLTWALRWRGLNGVLNDMAADEVFQVINEALANVYRHSSAKHVEVQGRVRDDMFEVTVRDDGIGFDVAQALRMDSRKLSFGLISMQERVSGLGGTLTLRSQSGRGTRVLISLPLRTEKAVRS